MFFTFMFLHARYGYDMWLYSVIFRFTIIIINCRSANKNVKPKKEARLASDTASKVWHWPQGFVLSAISLKLLVVTVITTTTTATA